MNRRQNLNNHSREKTLATEAEDNMSAKILLNTELNIMWQLSEKPAPGIQLFHHLILPIKDKEKHPLCLLICKFSGKTISLLEIEHEPSVVTGEIPVSLNCSGLQSRRHHSQCFCSAYS